MASIDEASGELPALTSATFFTKTRTGERFDIAAVDTFFWRLEEELFLTEGNRERSLEVTELIRAQDFPLAKFFSVGYVASEVRSSLERIAGELGADPEGPRNALVLTVESFLEELDLIDAHGAQCVGAQEPSAPRGRVPAGSGEGGACRGPRDRPAWRHARHP